MQALPGWVYIVAGAVISGVSWYVKSQTSSKVMLYFFFIGFVFLLIGVYKVARSFTKTRSEDDLAAFNMQESLNQAAKGQPGQFPQSQEPSAFAQSSPFPQQGQQQNKQMQMQTQTPMQGQQTRQQFQQAQQQAQQSREQSSAAMASQLFPFRGVKYDARQPQGQHVVQGQQQGQQLNPQQNQQGQQAGQQRQPQGQQPLSPSSHRVRNTPFDSPGQR